ncbi:MAG: sulfatase-like hydrolase/transferase [Phycisphaerales bacterium]|nr:sulfatase-like hydrolase/transferase [Phycisphaerales bacterium]
MGAGKVFHGRHDPASYHEFGGKFGEYGPRPPQKIAFPKGHPLWDWGVYPENDQDTPDHKIADWAIARLQQTYAQPFFLSAGFYRPHAPMFAPQKWFDLYPIDSLVMPPMRPHDLPPQRISDYAMQLTAGLAEPRHSEVLALGQFVQAVRSYLACVSFVDHQIGRVIEALDNSPHAANTLIVFWADHGFHVGTKERRGASVRSGEESTHVPLIFAGPGVTPGRCHRTVGTIDLYPTLLSQLKLPAREGLDGRDFTRLLAQPDAPWNGVALTSFSPGNHAVRDERYRYIRYADGSEELYDHETDPHEWNNLAGKPGTSDLVDHLARYMPVQEPPLVANSSGGDSPLLP